MPELKRPSDATRDPVTDEAAAWLLRVRCTPDDPDVRAELAAWLSRDARHAKAWMAAQQVWSLAGAVGPASGSQSRPVGKRRFRRSKRSVWSWGYGLAVAASICLVIAMYPSLRLQVQADYVSAVGATRIVELADGSRVHLDSGSAVAVDYTPGRRIVKLLAGQAFFTVRHDRERPFSVEAADIDVTVTGTEFDVRLASTDVSVAVAEGEVRVNYAQQAQIDATILVAGESLRVRRQGGPMERLQAPPHSIAPWRRGRLLIESATVGDLVNELRRYRSGAIVITDEALAGERVTGVFDLTDPIRALKTVVEPHAGRVREITPWLVIVSGS